VKTLIVSSYHADWTPKIRPVEEMVGLFSEYDTVSDVDLVPGYDLAGYGALVLSGSPNLISREEYLLPYVEFLRQVELPVLGICYGHQLLALAHGARVFSGKRFIEGYDTVRILEPEPLFAGLPDEIIVMESHREHVMLADLERTGFDLLANSTTCDVEAMHHVEKPLVGLQFHLERSGEIGQQVMERFIRFARSHKQ
jgi:GMP synthase (glutamine-hydrolysing)